MDTFTKQVSGVYDLVYDFSAQFKPGEVIKTYNPYLDDVLMTGVLPESGILDSYTQYDKDTMIMRVQNGVQSSGYKVSFQVTTNQANTYTKDVWLSIDDTDYPYAYDDFYYRFHAPEGDSSIYVLPDLRYGFGYNREYHVDVAPGLSGVTNFSMNYAYSFWFTVGYCPYFATATTIKLMGGPDIEGFSDDTIYRMIHKNTLDIIDMYNMTQASPVSYTYWGCTPANAPYQMRRYVECKTAYDLMNIADSIDNKGLAQSKRLGDMDISYGGSPASSKSDPNVKKELFNCFNGLISLLSNGVNVAVRGIYDSTKGYPHPVLDVDHNRIVRTVDTVRSNPNGPYREAVDWRYGSTINYRNSYITRYRRYR